MSKMFEDLLRNPNFVGSLIEITFLTTDEEDVDDKDVQVEFDESFVVKVDLREQLTLTLSKCKTGGKTLPGNQVYQIVKILHLKVLREGNGKVENKVAPAVSVINDNLSRVAPIGRSRPFRNDNKHLEKLLPIEIPELTQQKQFDMPPMPEVLDEAGRPRKIFQPVQDTIHMEGEKFSHRRLNELAVIRKKVWSDINTPPKLQLFPSKWYFIQDLESDKDAVDIALDEIRKQKQIGVALHGQTISRFGVLSTISVSTPDAVFTFDIVRLRSRAFDVVGLKEILESDSVVKVFHDCRCAADLLLHRYDVKLCNVFDIQGGNAIFLTWAYTAGFLPKYAFSLSHLARAYCGINTSFLFFPHFRADHLEEDMSIWLKRPLTSDLEFGILCDVIYLLDLRRLITEAMLSPVKIVSDKFVTTFRDDEHLASAHEVVQRSVVLPGEAIEALPNWEPNQRAAERIGFVDGRSVHQVVGQMDPVVIYSKDVLHQNKTLKTSR